MPTLNRETVKLTATVAAPAQLVFDLAAGLQDWSQFHLPAVHAEPLGQQDGMDLYRHWFVIDDHTVRTWEARWRFDRDALRIDFEFEPDGTRGTWTFAALSNGSTDVRIELSGDREQDLRALLASVAAAAEQNDARQDLVVDFEDTLFVSGSVEDAYRYLYEADKWAERIPHVSRLVLEEKVPNIQFFDMDTTTPDGSAHTTRSVRICLPETKILYKQIHLPKLLNGHTGHWRFTPTREGFVLGARHTAVIKPEALSILGPDTTVLDARKYLRRVLGTNSMGNLKLAKAYAEEIAGV